MSTPIDLTEIKEKIDEIEVKSANGEYIYRGEPERHEEPPHCGKASSSLWRKFCIEKEHFDVEVVQREMLNDAKKHAGQLPHDYHVDSEASLNPTEEDPEETINLEILTEIQHYGGETNLIDFTTDYFIALFFACDGVHDKEGRVILQETEKIRQMIKRPRNPRHRVIAQKSIFLRPPGGFIQPHEDDLVVIPAHLKPNVLQYLRKYHGISTETIYNDLHGFIRNQGIHGGAYTQFYRGYAVYDRADKATTSETKQEQYKKSIEHYTNAIGFKPHFSEAYTNRGAVYNKLGKSDFAIQDFSAAIGTNPNLAAPYFNRAKAYYHKGQYDLAIKDFNIAISIDCNDADAYNNRGVAYNSLGRYDLAIKDYNIAIELKPDYADAYNNRGVAYKQLDKLDCAINDCNKAIDLKPDYADAYINRGAAYRQSGKLDYAINDYNKAIDLKPDYADAYINRGAAYHNKHEYDRAIQDYNQAINLNPDHVDAHSNLGLLYYDKGDFDCALPHFNKAIELNPDCANAYFIRGLVLLRRGAWRVAKSDLTTAKNRGVDIVALFQQRYFNITDFEEESGVKLPKDIAAMLQPS